MAFGKLVSLTLIFYASSVAAVEEAASMSKMFLEMDRNRDGFLSPEEYGVDAEEFDPEVHSDEEINEYKQSQPEIKESFKRLDEDKDGRLSQAELAKPMEVSPGEEADMLELDKDQDGGLSMVEFGTGLEFDFKEDFDRADKDHDGKISLEELKAFNKGEADKPSAENNEEEPVAEKSEEEPVAEKSEEEPVAEKSEEESPAEQN